MEAGKPESGYIGDEKGNVFKINTLNKKQVQKMLEKYKKQGRVSISKLSQLYNRLYDIESRDMPKYAEMQRLDIKKKISKELHMVVDNNMQQHFKNLNIIKEQYDVVHRNQLVINMAILQLENGADNSVVLKLLKQCQLEDWNISVVDA